MQIPQHMSKAKQLLAKFSLPGVLESARQRGFGHMFHQAFRAGPIIASKPETSRAG